MIGRIISKDTILWSTPFIFPDILELVQVIFRQKDSFFHQISKNFTPDLYKFKLENCQTKNTSVSSNFIKADTYFIYFLF